MDREIDGENGERVREREEDGDNAQYQSSIIQIITYTL